MPALNFRSSEYLTLNTLLGVLTALHCRVRTQDDSHALNFWTSEYSNITLARSIEVLTALHCQVRTQDDKSHALNFWTSEYSKLTLC